MIVLGAALAVITLYIVPLDQITMALQTQAGIHAKFQAIRDRISANTHIPNSVKTKVTSHLSEVEYRIIQHLQSKGIA